MTEFINALANRVEDLEEALKKLTTHEDIIATSLDRLNDRVSPIEQFTDRIVALEHKLSDIEGYIIKPMKDKIYSLERKVSDMEDYLRQSDYE